MSGGVKNIPITKKLIIKYGLMVFMRSLDTNPVVITRNVAMGISKAKPKAKKSFNTKSKYLFMSVITWIESGAEEIKKLRIIGLTTKYAKTIPA
jgi:hypothetical protein